MSLQMGDKVELVGYGVSNSTEMIVKHLPAHGEVTVFWFDQNKSYQEAKFNERFLQPTHGNKNLLTEK